MIPGLQLIENLIDEKEESDLIEFINSQEWDTRLSRRTQHYGYIYAYDHTSQLTKTKEIPQLFIDVVNTLQSKFSFFSGNHFDQMIINEYEPGQGISAHIDNPILFDDTIVSITLGSQCVMTFKPKPNPDDKDAVDVLLPRRSAVILQGDARYKYTHEISKRKSDNKIKRGTRISLTFRKVK
jgi:alkylated DNA repair dioxygenase AlkB